MSPKEEFLSLLKSVQREGMDTLAEFLETKTDFFSAPASTKFHGNFEGGLVEHCLKVYKNYISLLELKGVEYDKESAIICALLHDVCKANNYVKESRNRKVDNKWESYEVWNNVKAPQIPLPHSARSIKIIKSFIPLKFREELTIYYHMGPYGDDNYEYRNLISQVNTKYPETLLFYTADLITSYLDEKIVE